MNRKQRIALLGVVAVALILAACDSDSGNNSLESEEDSSSSIEFSSSSEQINFSSVVKSSSSSVGVSSSSLVVSSSSVKSQSSSSAALSSSVEVCINTYGTNTVTDCRDNQTYKTVVIGTQTWMAENLNYAVDSSWCYNSSADSCAKYGRLYQWASAMNIDFTYSSTIWGGSDVNHQGICPEDWHLPSNDEWQILYDYVDANNGSEGIGASLKSVDGWQYDANAVTGTNQFGFSVLPAGNRNDGYFYYAGDYTYFWGATEYDSDFAYYWHLNYSNGDFGNDSDASKNYGFSVRCLKD